MCRQNSSVAGQSKSQCFIQTIHGVGGEHSRTGTTGWTCQFFQQGDLFIRNRVISTHDHGIYQVIFFPIHFTRFHRSAGNKNSRDIKAHGSHQHAGSDFIAIADTNQSINFMRIAHIFHAISDQVTGRQGIKHTVVPHGNAIIHRNGIKLSGKITFALDH